MPKLRLASECVLAAKVLGTTKIATTELMLYSVLVFDDICFITSCDPGLWLQPIIENKCVGFNQRLVTRRVTKVLFKMGANFALP